MNIKKFEKRAAKAADMLRVMGNENRLMILCQLGRDEYSVGELLPLIGLSQSALSQHLAKLRDKKLVKTRRQSQTIYYSVDDPNTGRILEALYGIYCPTKGGGKAAKTALKHKSNPKS